MGVRKDDLTQYIQQLETVKADIPAIMSKIAAGEGAYAVKQARLICRNDNVIGAGAYRRNWQSDKAAKRSGRRYIVRFYNPLDYASHLEYGFRSHFVPGRWEGHTFSYGRNDPTGAHDVYQAGEYMRWVDGLIYRCKVDATVHGPVALPGSWEVA